MASLLARFGDGMFAWTAHEALTRLRAGLKRDHFDAARDLPTLRRLLLRIEAREGICDVHRWCTEWLMANAHLTHRFGHEGELSAVGMSPDGRYLATGSDVPRDGPEGGALLIWEVETGRCIQLITSIPWGVSGSHGSSKRTIQWSPDGRLLGFVHEGQIIDIIDPFKRCSTEGVLPEPRTELGPYWGRSVPPGWTWSPACDRVVLSVLRRDGSTLPLALFPVDGEGYNYDEGEDDQGQRLGFEAPDRFPENDYWPWSEVYWEEGRIFGHTDGPRSAEKAFVCHAETGALLFEKDIGATVTWRRDGRYLACSLRDGEGEHRSVVMLYSAEDSKACWRLEMPADITELSFEDSGDRLAVLMESRAEVVLVEVATGRVLVALKSAGFGEGSDYFFPDGCWWSWSSTGCYAALRTEVGVAVYECGPTVELVQHVDFSEDIGGVYWGSSDVLVGVGPTTIEFWSLEERTWLSRNRVHGPTVALMAGRKPALDEFDWWGCAFPPYFPMCVPRDGSDTFEWVLVSPSQQGCIYTSAPVLPSELDVELSWVVVDGEDRVCGSWPFRWGTCELRNMQAYLDSLE